MKKIASIEFGGLDPRDIASNTYIRRKTIRRTGRTLTHRKHYRLFCVKQITCHLKRLSLVAEVVFQIMQWGRLLEQNENIW